DLFILGEGEEVNLELMDLYHRMRREGATRQAFLREAAKLEGIYVPSLYDVTYNPDGTIRAVTPKDSAPATVKKRIIRDFDKVYYPENFVVPFTEIVHDRVSVEVLRGCIRGCRFCQAGFLYRPFREKSEETVYRECRALCEHTGYDEVSLSSLSTSDHSRLDPMLRKLLTYTEAERINLSLPSLRADNFSMELMEKLQKVRKSGLTFAVEGGSQRLRDAINKNVTEEDLLHTCAIAFAGGWNNVKLYYMLGLPTETDEDIVGIAEMANQVLHCWRQNATNKNRGVKITISTSCFIPKPHSPFQWEAQISKEEYLRRVELLRSSIIARNVTYNWHDAETSVIEAALSRGDRKLSAVIEEVWKNGGRLEAWSDYFSYQRWVDAFAKCGLDIDFYASRERGEEELLPWDMIDVGVRKAHLLHERQQCYASALSPDCRKQCSACGAARLLKGGKCDG
ncbi:MAG: TIGR03960 family B12-binding radical SAM protein, partial [Candidatus Limivicinus sp.]|nr:TIGR03960 family B12-binding radical SAM protein [Candidatus Limivicinus sp.]